MKHYTPHQIADALQRAEAAEHFTSPPGRVCDPLIYRQLDKQGFTEWRNGTRLTDAGRGELRKLEANGTVKPLVYARRLP